MSDQLYKLLLFLAANDYNDEQIKALIKEFANVDPRAIGDRVRYLRSLAQRDILRPSVGLQELANERESKASQRHVASTAVINDIIQLLKEEAHLTNRQVVAMLSQSILGSENALPMRSRESLSSWLRRLTKDQSSSRILSEATRIRNSFKHGPIKVGWGLDDVK